jgi:hypothetical protein
MKDENMSLTQRLEAWLNSNVWRFFRAVFNTNRDFPYHDYVVIDNSEGTGAINGVYQVGQSNMDLHGDQAKRFVSKRTLILCTDSSTVIVFNDSKNVPMIPFYDQDTLNNLIRQEYHTNIHAVYYSVATNDMLLMYFEGVLPQEARNPE